MSETVGLSAIEEKSGIGLDILREWMDQHDIGSGEITGAELLVGGTQNILLKYRRKDSIYVLRRPPLSPRPGNDETMRREARVLSALNKTSVPHPTLISACGDSDVLGVSFYIMEWIEGFNPTTGLPDFHASDPLIRKKMGLNLVKAAVQLSNVDYEKLGLEDFGNKENYLSRQISRWMSQLDSYSDVSSWPGADAIPGVVEVSSWLKKYQPQSFIPGLMHGDFHIGNVMFQEKSPEISAIIDWELSTIGDPLIDFAWLLATWPDESGKGGVFDIQPWHGFPEKKELIKLYSESSYRDLSTIDWYIVFACFKLGVLLESTYVRACAGKVPMSKGESMRRLTITLFKKALSII